MLMAKDRHQPWTTKRWQSRLMIARSTPRFMQQGISGARNRRMQLVSGKGTMRRKMLALSRPARVLRCFALSPLCGLRWREIKDASVHVRISMFLCCLGAVVDYDIGAVENETFEGPFSPERWWKQGTVSQVCTRRSSLPRSSQVRLGQGRAGHFLAQSWATDHSKKTSVKLTIHDSTYVA